MRQGMPQEAGLAMDAGTLYVCGTPIGNLEDAGLRLIRILGEVDLIAAEDTRMTRKLLSRYGIRTPLTSLHARSEQRKTEAVLAALRQGKSVALVSDAGMPVISDPGGLLIAAVVEAGIRVEAVPGPSALLTALVLSGIKADRFVFDGFVPRRGRRRMLEEWRREERTIVFYESPHRILGTLRDVLEVVGDRRVAVARELTKRFEEVFRGRVSEAVAYFEMKQPQGEFTVVLEGAAEGAKDDAGEAVPPPVEELRREYDGLVAEGVDRRAAVKELARRYKLHRREVYERLFV